MLGVKPDTSQCACAACGGAVLILSQMDLVVGDDQPDLTGLPRPLRESDGDGPPQAPSDDDPPQ